MDYQVIDTVEACLQRRPEGKYLEFEVGRCHLVVKETSPGQGVIVSMTSAEPSDYLIAELLPGALVQLATSLEA